MSNKVVINDCWGGFGLSEKALQWLRSHGITDEEALSNWDFGNIPRHDPLLIELVETLGEEANGRCANLRVVDISPSTRYRLNEYDGAESVDTPESIQWVTIS